MALLGEALVERGSRIGHHWPGFRSAVVSSICGVQSKEDSFLFALRCVADCYREMINMKLYLSYLQTYSRYHRFFFKSPSRFYL